MLAVFETGIGEGRELCNRGCRGRMTRALPARSLAAGRSELWGAVQAPELRSLGLMSFSGTTCDISSNKQHFPDSARPLHNRSSFYNLRNPYALPTAPRRSRGRGRGASSRSSRPLTLPFSTTQPQPQPQSRAAQAQELLRPEVEERQERLFRPRRPAARRQRRQAPGRPPRL